MKLTFKICTLAVIFVFAASLFASAADFTDTLRIGIYYDSSKVSSLDLNCDDGLAAGIFKDRQFVCGNIFDETSATVKPSRIDGVPSFHVDYSSFSDPGDAANYVDTLVSVGMDAFVAYFDSSFHVMGGFYKNENDALWAAQNLSVVGTPVQVSSKALALFDSSGKIIFLVDDSTYGVTVYSKDFENKDSLLKISGNAKGTYRGGFECRLLDGDTITVVNTIGVEQYLYSVVCREMSPSWEVEALKAQAVCARNFALGRINYHSKYGFDVCRTTCCQAYSTSADNSENVHTAVDQTFGELLFYEDKLVQAVYSSSMGKYTESVENVWGSKFPYLVSVENPYEDTENVYNGIWSKSLTKSRATEIMNSRGYSIGNVTDITVLERTPAGSVLKLKVQGTEGSKIFERESCRNIFSEATYSQKYTVTLGGQSVYPTVYTSNGLTTSALTLDSVSVLSGNNSVSTPKQLCVAFDGKSQKEYKTTSTLGDSNTFIFSGEGWGHGVGMSQYGAKGMAQAGFDYQEILTHYYTGTHIEKAY